MIGHVDFIGVDHRPARAVLTDDCVWECAEHAYVARVLNDLLRQRALDASASDGNIYLAAIDEAARHLNGTATFEPKSPPPDDAVF